MQRDDHSDAGDPGQPAVANNVGGYSTDELRFCHQHRTGDLRLLEVSKQYACFHCMKRGKPGKVIARQDSWCPRCGVDACLPLGEFIPDAFLQAMHDLWHPHLMGESGA